MTSTIEILGHVYWNREVPTSDDNVLESSGNCTVPLGRKQCLVAGLQPDHAVLVGNESLACLLRIIPVSLGQLVSCHAEFAALAHGHCVAFGIDDFGLSVGHDFTHSGQTGFYAVGRKGIEASRRSFRETCYIGQLQILLGVAQETYRSCWYTPSCSIPPVVASSTALALEPLR